MEMSKKNHGIVKSKIDGATVMEAFGKDDSDVTGSASKERSPHKMGGGITNLSHSLSGTSANQKGS